MGTRREYTQTSQVTRSQVEDLMAYNIAVRNYALLTQDEEELSNALSNMLVFLKTVGYINTAYFNGNTTIKIAKTVASAIISFIKSNNDNEIETIDEMLMQGYWGLHDVKSSFIDNPSWEMVEMTHGVLLFVDEGIKISTSRTNSIDRVKINGSWVS